MSEPALQLPDTPDSGPAQRNPRQPMGPQDFLARLKAEKAQPEPPTEKLEAEDGEEGDGQPETEAASESALPPELQEAEVEEPEEGAEEAEASAEEEADAEESDAEEETGAEVGEIELDGETVSLDEVREWKLGHMRQADYTRKTQAVAEQRKALEAQATELSEFGEFYNRVADSMVAGFEQVNWPQLRAEAPEKYQQLRQAWNVRAQEADTIRQQAQAFTQKVGALKEQAREEQIERAREVLPNLIPNWSPEVYSDVLEYAVHEAGYSQEEAAEIIDPRVIRALYDSMRLNKASQRVTQNGKPKPKPRPKPQGRQAEQKPVTRPDGKMRAAYARLQKNPQDKGARVAFYREKLAYERAQKGQGR